MRSNSPPPTLAGGLGSRLPRRERLSWGLRQEGPGTQPPLPQVRAPTKGRVSVPLYLELASVEAAGHSGYNYTGESLSLQKRFLQVLKLLHRQAGSKRSISRKGPGRIWSGSVSLSGDRGACRALRDWGLASVTWTDSGSQLVDGRTRKTGCCPLCGPVLPPSAARGQQSWMAWVQTLSCYLCDLLTSCVTCLPVV